MRSIAAAGAASPGGASARAKPSFAASFNRASPCVTGRTSPDNPISPKATARRGAGVSVSEETSAAATARSAAGSATRKPPATLRYTSLPPRARPQRASSTARIIASRAESHPTTARRGVDSGEGAISASISTRSGRVPSTPANTEAPLTGSSRSTRNRPEGLATSRSPRSVIANTPISSVAPKRFLTARRMRNAWPRSPSK